MAYPFECSVKFGVSNIEKPCLWEKTRSLFTKSFIKMRAAPPLQTKILFEPLEPRILLSADISFGAANDELTLRLVEDQGQDVFELIDIDSNVIASANRDTSDNQVNVTGSAIGNLLTLDDSLIDAGITLNFTGGGGDDSVAAFESDNIWAITGTESSTLNDSFVFSDVESLTGGDLQDTLLGTDLAATVWEVTEEGGGNVLGINFSGFEILTGGTVSDTIRNAFLASEAAITGSGAGIFSDLVFTEFDAYEGFGTDTLFGPVDATSWQITGAGTGNVLDISFNGVSEVVGDIGIDTLVNSTGSSQTLSITNPGSGALNGISFRSFDTYTGTGTDSITGSDVNRIWLLDGEDSGLVSNITFSGVQNLTGGESSDVFIIDFASGADLAGTIDGGSGDGFDSLVIAEDSANGVDASTVDFDFTAGTVTFDTKTINFTGLEISDPLTIDESDPDNVIVNGTPGIDIWTLSGSGDGTVTIGVSNLFSQALLDFFGDASANIFQAPTGSLTINLDAGPDQLTITDFSLTTGLDLIIDGNDGDITTDEEFFDTVLGDALLDTLQSVIPSNDKVIIDPNVVVSTRDLDDANPNPDFLTGSSLGDSGTITIDAEEIVVSAGAQIVAHVEDGGLFSPGDITLRAFERGIIEQENAGPVTFSQKVTSIDVGANAVINGNNLILSATAEDVTFTSLLGIPAFFSTFVADEAVSTVENLSALPFKVLFKESDASVIVNEGVQLTGAAGVTVEAIATSVATGIAKSSLFSAGYGQAIADAEVQIKAGAVINAGEAVVVASDANAEAVMNSETERDLGAFPNSKTKTAFSLAISRADATSTATVVEGAIITSGKTANIAATGSSITDTEAEAGVHTDGRAGLAFALDFSNANITTQVDGTVTAQQIPGSVVKIEFNPTATDSTDMGFVDPENRTIRVGEHALATGDVVNYTNRRGTSIGGIDQDQLLGGLVDGTDYFVITTDDPELIKLARTRAFAFDGVAIDLESEDATGAALNTKTFDISSANADTDEIILENEAFSGSGIDFSLLGSTFELGQAVLYEAPDSGAIGGLEDGKVYYIVTGTNQFNLEGDQRDVFIGEQIILLAETENEARAGVAIDIDTTGVLGEHSLSALHVLDSGLATGIGVIASLDAETNAATTAGIIRNEESGAVQGKVEKFNSAVTTPIFERIFNTLNTKQSENSDAGGSGSSPSLQLAGAFSFSLADHTVESIVGSTADLNSNEDLEVVAEISHEFQHSAETSINTPKDTEAAETAISAAVIIGLFDNTAQATVSSGANLDALRATRVISDVTYPFLTRPDEFFPANLGELVDLLKTEGYDAVNDYLDGTLGIQSKLFNSWARSTAKAGGVAIAGSVNFLLFNNVSEATIESGAQINQDLDFRSSDTVASPDQHVVSVEATNYMQTFNTTGVFDFQFPSAVINPSSPEFDSTLSVSPVATGGDKGGVGGAIYLSFLDNTTTALVEEDVAIFSGNSGGFNMKAEEAIFSFNFAQAGAKAGKYAFAGTFAYTQQISDTLVHLSKNVDVTGQSVNLYAGSLESHINWTGGVAKGVNLGFGASIGINNITRNTKVLLGDEDAPGTGTNIDVDGDITILAKNDGELWALSLAAAISADTSNQTAGTGGSGEPLGGSDALSMASLPGQASQNDDAGQQGSTGLALAGDISFNRVVDNVEAIISDAGSIITASTLDISAINATEVISASGAAAFANAGNASQSIGIAGSLSVNIIDGTTDALIIGGLTLQAANLSVTAERTGRLIAVSAGGSAAPKKNGTAIAGSVSVNIITNDTEASIDHAAITVDSDIGVSANDDSNIIAVGGGFAYGKNNGFGAAIGFNLISNTTEAAIRGTDAATTINRGGSLNVNAKNDNDIFAASVSLGISTAQEGLAGAGTVSVNIIGDPINRTHGVRAAISNTQDQAEGTDVSVTAEDNSEIIAVAGAIAGTGGKAAFGGAIAYNGIFGDADASIADSTLLSSGSVLVEGKTVGSIFSLSAGVSVSTDGFALAGAVSVNQIENQVGAHITGSSSNIQAAGLISVIASDESTIRSIAGNVAYGAKFSGGASIAVNIINNNITAEIDAATVVTNNGAVEVQALSTSLVQSLAAGGNFSQKAAIGGSVTVTDIDNTIDALIQNAASVTAAGDITVNAVDHSTIESGSGQFSISSGSGSFGAAVVTNTINNDTTAAITDSAIISSAGSVRVLAESDAVPTDSDLLSGNIFDPTVASGETGFVDTTGNTINLGSHGLISGQAVVYSNGGNDSIGGLNDGETYFVIVDETDNTLVSLTQDIDTLREALDDDDTTTATLADVSITSLTSSGGAGDHVLNGDSFVTQEPDESFIGNRVTSFAFSGVGGNSFALGGSVVVTDLDDDVIAKVSGGTMTADGSVLVESSSDNDVTSFAGQLTGSTNSTAVGLSNSTIITDNTVEAFVDGTVTAKGNTSLDVLTGEKPGDSLLTETATGLIISAISFEDLDNFAVGGSGAGSSAVAGSASVASLVEDTKAYIGANADINNTDAADEQSVLIRAADSTDTLGIGGGAAFAGSGGIGAGVDVQVIIKTTEAKIEAGVDVDANNNVIVEALSVEDLTTVGGAIAGGGNLALAGAVGVSVITPTTRAYIGSAATVDAGGSVVVSSQDENETDVIAINASGAGTTALGGAAAVPVVVKTTEAYIDIGAQVTALGEGDVLTVNSGTITSALVPLIDAGSLNEVEIPEIANDLIIDPLIDAASERETVIDTIDNFTGVTVSAVNTDDIELFSLGGSAGGSVAVQIAATVNVVDTTINAYIADNASVTAGDSTGSGTDQSVRVVAGNDFYHLGIAGAGAAGGVAAGVPAAEVVSASITTEAKIGKNASVSAQDDITVAAIANEEIFSIGVGIAIAGKASGAGTGVVVVLNNTTHALIDENATVLANDNVIVTASDTTETDVIAGAVGGALFGSIGAGVGVSVINKDTQAYIATGANVDALASGSDTAPTVFNGGLSEAGVAGTETTRGIIVNAFSSEDVTATAVAGAAAIGALAGAVTVEVIDSDTQAHIDTGAQINQNDSGAGSEQSVNVSAVNDLTMEVFDGAISLSLVGLSGSVDVGVVRNDTAAYINGTVSAENNIDVNAISDRDINTQIVSGAVSGASLAAAVFVYNIAGNLVSTYTTEDGSSQDVFIGEEGDDVVTHVNEAILGSSISGDDSLLSQYSSSDSSDNSDDVQSGAEMASNSLDTLYGTDGSLLAVGSEATESNETPTNNVPAGTVAFIGADALVQAGGDVDLDARGRMNMSGLTGALSVGTLASVGASVGVVTIAENIEAFIGDTAVVQAGLSDSAGDVLADAVYNQSVDGDALGGSIGGFVGLGAAVIVVSDSTSISAHIDSAVTNADDVNFNATSSQGITAFSGNGNASLGLAAGASVAHVTMDGSTSAYVADGAQVGEDSASQVDDLLLTADSAHVASAEGVAISAGILASGAGSDIQVDIDPVIQAYVGDAATIKISGNLEIKSESSAEGDSKASGIAIAGGVSAGVNFAVVDVDVDVQSFIASNAVVVADNVLVFAEAKAEDTRGTTTTDVIQGIDTDSDTLDFTIGVNEGDTVSYNAEDPDNSIGGLSDGREYNVLVEGTDLIALGSIFDGASVDPNQDTITFALPHKLETGDVVIYDNGSNNSIFASTPVELVVRRIDDNTIKLARNAAEANLSVDSLLPTFLVSNVDSTNNEIEIAGQSFSLNQAVTYRAPTATEFSSRAVDVALDGDELATEADDEGNQVPTLETDDNNKIFIEDHSFAVDDLVIYEANGTVIGLLESGETYKILETTVNTIKLAEVGSDTEIDLMPSKDSTSDIAVTHSLLKTTEQPITGLNDGQTYYVVNISNDTFQLSSTNPDIDGTTIVVLATDDLATDVVHRLGTEGYDLVQSSGDHELRLDLTDSLQGEDRLLGPGGVALDLISPPTGDGKSSSSVSGGSGALLGTFSKPTAKTTVDNTVLAYIAAESVDAVSNVQIETTTAGSASATATNLSLALGAAIGDVEANATINSDSRAFVGNPSTSNGSNISGEGVQITAGGQFNLISHTSSNNVRSNATAEGGGILFSDSNASAFTDLISTTDSRVGENANIQANTVNINASSDISDAFAKGKSFAAGFLAVSTSRADIDHTSNVQVILEGDSTTDTQIRADEGADISVNQTGFQSNRVRDPDCLGICFNRSRGSLDNIVNTDIVANPGVTVIVGARQDGTPLATSDDLSRLALYVDAQADINEDITSGSENGLITWNSDVVFLLGGSDLLLRVDADGNVVEQENIDSDEFLSSDTDLVILDLDATEDDTGQALFTGDDGVDLTGTQATFSYLNTWESVTIIAEGDQRITTTDITPYRSSAGDPADGEEDVQIDVLNDSGFSFAVAQIFEPTLIDIQSLGTEPIVGPEDFSVVFEGVIDNPIGTTSVTVESGDIASRFFEDDTGLVRTNILTLDVNGNVGPRQFEFIEGFRRPEIELVNSENRPTDLIATATEDINLDIRGLQREATLDPLVITAGDVVADGNVLLRLYEGFDQTTLPEDLGDDFTIEVFETSKVTSPSDLPTGAEDGPDGGRTTEVTDQYRPDSLPLDPVDLPISVFGTGQTEIEVTYDFNLIQAGLDIDITARGGISPGDGEDPDTTINLIAGTNIAANADNGSFGNVDVDFNGDVTLTESEDDLRVGLIATEGDVSLTAADGSIIDATDDDDGSDTDGGDTDADVIADNFVFSAPNSGIGSEANVLEIDSSFIIIEDEGQVFTDGTLTATADDDIFITKISGNMNIDSVVSGANVDLVTDEGSILDASNDDITDVEGALITLSANGGAIGGVIGNDGDPEFNPLETNLVEDGGDLLGDFNDDGIVNTFDLAIFKTNFGTTNSLTDLNDDGIVNTFDLAIFKSVFGTTGGGDGIAGLTAFATNSIRITETEGTLFVNEVISETGLVMLTVLDDDSNDNDLVVAVDGVAGSISANFDVILNIGDDFELPSDATITSGSGGITIAVDQDEIEPDDAGGSVTIAGLLGDNSFLILAGGEDEDVFDVTFNSGVTITTFVDGNAPDTTSTPGDTLLVTTDSTATITTTDEDSGTISIAGVGSISYDDVETVNIVDATTLNLVSLPLTSLQTSVQEANQEAKTDNAQQSIINVDVIPPKVSTTNSEDVTSPSIIWDKIEESDRPVQERSSLALGQTQVFDSEKGGFFYVDELDVSNLEEAIDTDDDNSTSETTLIDWS